MNLSGEVLKLPQASKVEYFGSTYLPDVFEKPTESSGEVLKLPQASTVEYVGDTYLPNVAEKFTKYSGEVVKLPHLHMCLL